MTPEDLVSLALIRLREGKTFRVTPRTERDREKTRQVLSRINARMAEEDGSIILHPWSPFRPTEKDALEFLSAHRGDRAVVEYYTSPEFNAFHLSENLLDLGWVVVDRVGVGSGKHRIEVVRTDLP